METQQTDKVRELLKTQPGWPLSIRETTEKLSNALGETPLTWKTRLTNWRRAGSSVPLQCHQEAGKHPCYFEREIDDFIKQRLAARQAVAGKAPQLANVKAVALESGIVLEWSSPAASGRCRINLESARALGVQLIALSDAYSAQVSDGQQQEESK